MTYRSLAHLKVPLLYTGVDVVDNKLFVLGGCNKEGAAQNTAQMLNMNENNEFILLENLPRKKAGTTVVHLNEKIVSIGGIINKNSPLDNVDVFDKEQQVWLDGPTLPVALQNVKCVVRDNALYCVGGLTAGMVTKSTLFRWDHRETNCKWEMLANMTSPRFSPGVFEHGDQLYVLGGRREKLFCSACECYDIRSDRWRELESVPSEYRHIFGGYGRVGGQVLIMGGLCEDPKQGFSSSVFQFDIANTEKWSKLTNMLKPRADFGMLASRDKVTIFGGLGSLQSVPKSVEQFDAKTKKWSLCDELPEYHASSASVQCSESSTVLVGGLSHSGPSCHVTLVTI